MPKRGAAEGPEGGKASKWKQQSAQLRLAMQANKGGSRGEAAAAMLAETHQVSLLCLPFLQGRTLASQRPRAGTFVPCTSLLFPSQLGLQQMVLI